MRHQAQVQRFSRKPTARVALVRGLVYSLVEHGRIRTTLAKAKELRRHVERAITLAREKDLAHFRLLMARFPNRDVVNTLVNDLGPRFKDRQGGYTRIIKLEDRPGDKASMAYIEFIDYKASVKEAPEAGESQDDKETSTSPVPIRVDRKFKKKKKKRIRKVQEHSRRILRVHLS